VQAGFNRGFKEGAAAVGLSLHSRVSACLRRPHRLSSLYRVLTHNNNEVRNGGIQPYTAGLAYGQVRGAACSVAIFAGQVPGSSGWKEKIAGTLKTMEELGANYGFKAARVDFERAMAAEAGGGEPVTPLRRIEEGGDGGGDGGDDAGGVGGSGSGASGGGGGDDGGGGGGAGDDAGAGSPLGKRKSDDEGAVEKTGDGSGGSSGGRGGDDGTFAGRMQAARSELESAGFELRDFKLT
jgi:hypothetical protein